jgi:hypothetical protein
MALTCRISPKLSEVARVESVEVMLPFLLTSYLEAPEIAFHVAVFSIKETAGVSSFLAALKFATHLVHIAPLKLWPSAGVFFFSTSPHSHLCTSTPSVVQVALFSVLQSLQLCLWSAPPSIKKQDESVRQSANTKASAKINLFFMV